MAETASSRPPTLEEAMGWIGHGLDDAEGRRIGRVRSVFADTESGEPTWLIVAIGRWRAKLLAVPLRDCAGAGGRVWTAHHREALRTAPAVDARRPLLREHELAICGHYGIGETHGRGAEVVGRRQGSITSQPAT